MTGEFDKSILLNNIAFLLRQQGKKVGELESVAGVSYGYLARNKDTASKMNIEFIVKAAKFLNVSLDTLIFQNLSDINPTAGYLIAFFDKLIRDTKEEKLDWQTEDEDSINNLLVMTRTNEIKREHGVNGATMSKRIYTAAPKIFYPSFRLELKNSSVLYLLAVSDPDDSSKAGTPWCEVWVQVESEFRFKFLASGLSLESVLAPKIAELYTALVSYLKRPRLSEDLQAIIDAYMKDYGENDSVDEKNLPF